MRSDPWRTPLLVVGVGVLVGALTSLGQRYLPPELSSLANSATSWSVVAFAVALSARRWWGAVAAAVGTFVMLLAGYELASQLRLGFGMATSTTVMWLALALVAGPVLGVAAWWGRRGPGLGRAAAVGLVAGLAVGEGVYGLTVVAETTSPVYWWLSVAAGVVALVLHAARARSLGLVAAAVAVTAVVATGFWGVYAAL